jgi:hypothetical protein
MYLQPKNYLFKRLLLYLMVLFLYIGLKHYNVAVTLRI